MVNPGGFWKSLRKSPVATVSSSHQHDRKLSFSLKQRLAYSLRAGSLFSWRIGDDVRKPVGRLWRNAVLVSCALLLILSSSGAQQDDEPGHSIGKVSTKGDLIVMELGDGALGKANLFDLTGHTLRFTPERPRYRVVSGPLHWDSDYGPELTGAEASLHKFAFPFSGKPWNSFLVGATGTIRLGMSEKDISPDPYGGLQVGTLRLRSA